MKKLYSFFFVSSLHAGGLLGSTSQGVFGFSDRLDLFQETTLPLDSQLNQRALNPAAIQLIKQGQYFGVFLNKETDYAKSADYHWILKQSQFAFSTGFSQQKIKSYIYTDEHNNELGGSFEPFALNPYLATSVELFDKWVIGTKIALPMEKLADQKGDQMAIGAFIDLGLIHRLNSREEWSLGLRHFGRQFRSYTESSSGSGFMDFHLDLAYKKRSTLFPRWTWDWTLTSSAYAENRLITGFSYRVASFLHLALRAPLYQSDFLALYRSVNSTQELKWEEDALAMGGVRLGFSNFQLNTQVQFNRVSPWSVGAYLSWGFQNPTPQKTISLPLEQVRPKLIPLENSGDTLQLEEKDSIKTPIIQQSQGEILE